MLQVLIWKNKCHINLFSVNFTHSYIIRLQLMSPVKKYIFALNYPFNAAFYVKESEIQAVQANRGITAETSLSLSYWGANIYSLSSLGTLRRLVDYFLIDLLKTKECSATNLISLLQRKYLLWSVPCLTCRAQWINLLTAYHCEFWVLSLIIYT